MGQFKIGRPAAITRGRRYNRHSLGRDAAGYGLGLAEVLDCLLLRPALLYTGQMLAPNTAMGVVAGKLAADLIFYVPTIVSYELLHRRAPHTFVHKTLIVTKGG